MRAQVSIPVSENLLKEVDEYIGYSRNRSAFIEEAIKAYLVLKRKLNRDQRDLELINSSADELNHEADDVLDYQVEI
jgi:metal-responsive CopG/Arc/MetJ family transcriptional regulator